MPLFGRLLAICDVECVEYSNKRFLWHVFYLGSLLVPVDNADDALVRQENTLFQHPIGPAHDPIVETRMERKTPTKTREKKKEERGRSLRPAKPVHISKVAGAEGLIDVAVNQTAHPSKAPGGTRESGYFSFSPSLYPNP